MVDGLVRHFAVGLGVVVLTLHGAFAADAKLPSGDSKFVQEAASGGLYEVQAGQLAAQKATNPPVKEMAQHIVGDHQKAAEKLKAIAQAKGAPVPAILDKKHRRKLDRLNKLSGAEFDRKYAEMMVDDHQSDIKKFKSEAEKGNDADLKQFAAETLPTLEQHLSMAKEAVTSTKTK